MEFTAQFGQFAQPIYSAEGLKACEAFVLGIPMVSSLAQLFPASTRIDCKNVREFPAHA